MVISIEFIDGTQQDFKCHSMTQDADGNWLLVHEHGYDIGFINKNEVRWAIYK